MTEGIHGYFTEQGWCHVCHSVQDVIAVTDPKEVAAIQEDAQSPADYFLVVEHNNPHTGEKCEGSGKTPEGLHYVDEGPDYDDPPGDEDDEDMGNEPTYDDYADELEADDFEDYPYH